MTYHVLPFSAVGNIVLYSNDCNHRRAYTARNQRTKRYISKNGICPADAGAATDLTALAVNKRVKMAWVHATNDNADGWRKGTSDSLRRFHNESGGSRFFNLLPPGV